MGDNTQITTQSALGEANFIVQEFANNLGAHSNASLSVAHGIDTFPALNPDSAGNNRTYFEDSHGNIVGTRHIRFIVDGISYWVPGQDSVLAGQPANNNITNLQGATNDLGTGDDNWVTVFEQQSVDSIVTVNTDYLLPHVKLGHWETHGSVSVEAETTLNSAGYEIGDMVIKLAIGGVVYKIPAHTRFGGPVQWWSSGRVSTNANFSLGHNIAWYGDPSGGSGGGNASWGVFYYHDSAPAKGTFPRKVTWQLNANAAGASSTWLDIPIGGGVASGFGWTGNSTLAFGGYSIPNGTATTNPVPMTVYVSEGENWRMAECVVRAKIVSNFGGSPTRTTYTGLCQFLAQDEASGYLTWYSAVALKDPSYGPPYVSMRYVGYNQFA